MSKKVFQCHVTRENRERKIVNNAIRNSNLHARILYQFQLECSEFAKCGLFCRKFTIE
jgi:hypothetical protein